MTRPLVRVLDFSTNETIDREMNDAEFAQFEIDQAAQAKAQAEVKAKVAQRQALLTRLGITEEEASLLLGGN